MSEVKPKSFFGYKITRDGGSHFIISEMDYAPGGMDCIKATEKVELIEKSAYDKAIEALKACCKPEPDGHGDFVADEFTQQEVLDGRKLLKELGVE